MLKRGVETKIAGQNAREEALGKIKRAVTLVML
jgi:hypothetical protein